MPTLGEACQQLGITRRTLDKWLTRLDIEPERHPQDWRYRTLTDEQIQRIADERALMPGLPASGQNAAVTRSQPNLTAQGGRADTFPIRRPHGTPVKASGATRPLPDGWMNKKEAAVLHGIPRATIDDWCKAGKVETDPGTYGGVHGHWPIVQPITQRGLAQFYRLASPRSDFRRCDLCPHTAASDADGAETPIPAPPVR